VVELVGGWSVINGAYTVQFGNAPSHSLNKSPKPLGKVCNPPFWAMSAFKWLLGRHGFSYLSGYIFEPFMIGFAIPSAAYIALREHLKLFVNVDFF
jgi:hypothetical protein